MGKSYQRTLLLSLLLPATVLTGCEQYQDITSVTEPAAYEQAAVAKPKSAKVLTRHADNSGGTVTTEWVTSGQRATLKLGKYELFVPKGAVQTPTTFRMTVLRGPVIGVSLEAFDNQGNPVREFRTPLRLTLPYDEAHVYNIEDCKLYLANVVSESDLTILEVVNVSVDQKRQTVTGNITHFSLWTLAKELSPGID